MWRATAEYGIRRPVRLKPVRTTAPMDCLVELMLGDARGRQPVIPVRTPAPPEEPSIGRRNGRITPNAAIAAAEFHDSVVGMRWGGGRKAKRQDADCESKFFHCQNPPGLCLPPQLSSSDSKRHELPNLRCYIAVLVPHDSPADRPDGVPDRGVMASPQSNSVTRSRRVICAECCIRNTEETHA